VSAFAVHRNLMVRYVQGAWGPMGTDCTMGACTMEGHSLEEARHSGVVLFFKALDVCSLLISSDSSYHCIVTCYGVHRALKTDFCFGSI